jgi:Family of unknown function (DUF6516)
VPQAELYLHTKLTDDEGNVREIVIWKVEPRPEAPEGVRYRLAFVPVGQRRPAILYDNHPPKGHHRHEGVVQSAYQFETVAKLLSDSETSIGDYLRKS